MMQVFGDAVIDKAPVLVLTNYKVTIFMRRHEDVHDKCLQASTPVWYDQLDPPVRASWLYAMKEAVVSAT
jgi:hypothetical protein